MGPVKVSGLLGRKLVAPNSPIDTAKEKAAPTRAPRIAIGRSITRRIWCGAAPKVAATSRIFGFICLRAGTIVRITKGVPIRACAMGTIHHDVLRSRGG